MAKKSSVTKAAVPAGMDDYQAQDDMRTLMQAHEVRSDPKRHAAAKAHAKKKLAAMQRVASGKMDAEDLRDGGRDEATEKNP